MAHLFLSHCPDISVDNPMRITCLNGHIDVVQHLIDAGATAHRSPQFFLDVLSQSSISPFPPQLLDILRSNDAPVNLDDAHLLVRAASLGLIALVREILEHTARMEADADDAAMEVSLPLPRPAPDVQLPDRVSQSRSHAICKALESSCVSGHVEVVEYLYTRAPQGMTFSVAPEALMLKALLHGHEAVAELLYSMPGLRAASVQYQRLWLQHAARMGFISLFNRLFEFVMSSNTPDDSFDINGCDAMGHTLLSHVFEPVIINKLLDAKADVNPPTASTVLRSACQKLRPDAVKLLLDARASPGDATSASTPPLLGAMEVQYPLGLEGAEMRQNHYTVINLLLAAGATTRWLVDQTSALSICVEHQDGPDSAILAGLLLQHDPELLMLPDPFGHTPLEAAIMSDNVDMVRALVDFGVFPSDFAGTVKNTPILFYVYGMNERHWTALGNLSNSRQILHILLNAGFDPTLRDPQGLTLLMAAVTDDIPEYVIDDGASGIFIMDVIRAVLHKHM
jgi:ankyrin repeat protein